MLGTSGFVCAGFEEDIGAAPLLVYTGFYRLGPRVGPYSLVLGLSFAKQKVTLCIPRILFGSTRLFGCG